MTLQELKTKVDNKLTSFWTTLVTRQEAYKAKNGRYFGLRVSAATVPVDGADEVATTNISPDEQHPEDYGFTVPSPLPFTIQVWQHGDAGFTARVIANVNGTFYTRAKSYGSVNNDQAWSVYDPNQIV